MSDYDYGQILSGLGRDDIILIDVRSLGEREDPGRIPGSYHVPFSEFEAAFKGPPAAFEAEYDFKVPSKDEGAKPIVLTGSGANDQRCLDASKILKSLQYENVSTYRGGLENWMSNGGKVRCSGKSAIVDYETVKGYLKNGSETLVIDVRKPSERLEPGRIPNTKNVPLSEVWSAFNMTPKEFKDRYGFPKPSLKASLCLHCLMGKRAMDAADKMSLMGFENVSVYKGSLRDWKENGGRVLKGAEDEYAH